MLNTKCLSTLLLIDRQLGVLQVFDVCSTADLFCPSYVNLTEHSLIVIYRAWFCMSLDLGRLFPVRAVFLLFAASGTETDLDRLSFTGVLHTPLPTALQQVSHRSKALVHEAAFKGPRPQPPPDTIMDTSTWNSYEADYKWRCSSEFNLRVVRYIGRLFDLYGTPFRVRAQWIVRMWLFPRSLPNGIIFLWCDYKHIQIQSLQNFYIKNDTSCSLQSGRLPRISYLWPFQERSFAEKTRQSKLN